MSNELLFFATELQQLVNPQLPEDMVAVQRGLLLYRQEMVYRKSEGEELISATVQDVTPCQVSLDLSFPTNSRCSCNQAGVCRHQMAVFFSSYSQIQSVSDWVHAWKNEAPGKSYGKIQLPLQRAKEIFLEEKPMERSYSSWKETMENNYQKQIVYFLSQPAYTLSVKWDAYLQRLKAKMPLEPEWKLLYLFLLYFHTYTFTLRALKHETVSGSARMFLEEEADELLDELNYLLDLFNRSARPFAFDEFFNGLQKDMDILLEDYGELTVPAINIYRSIWTDILKERSWRQTALVRMTETLETVEVKPDVCQTVLIAVIHLNLLTGKDREVPALLERLRPEDFPFISFWISHLDEQKSVVFLEYAIEHIQSYLSYLKHYYRINQFISHLSPYIRNYCSKTKQPDLFEKYCEKCMPHSLMFYSRALLENGKYKKWVELYIYNNVDYKFISNEELKLIQAHEPKLLLPLLTSIVSENIEAKNRQSYREAVRYLKKIRTVYKKEKNLEQWERYIHLIQTTHKRLRAFQEELKRGKLIHVD
ncbi:hypothetical protein IEO70_09135 [Bacillus sp. AGMB 02131]|uniref:SWIM-type domain-containing protein n=1 Tax=Peribacillus faecalis TaxID=2772559 RepID=A0A927HBI1_9BACI|nr:hypothetical protein [Peribacillus faecalis]MBD3108531.1 hypothetical protein [Peribacillus faecalis]